jgi:hypothetical protein
MVGFCAGSIYRTPSSAALVALGWTGPDGQAGKIDFGDLKRLSTSERSTRASQLRGRVATQNLRIDRRAEERTHVAAGPEAVDVGVRRTSARHRVAQGDRLLLHPVFAVDRLIDKALRPTIDEHLGRVGDDLDLPAATCSTSGCRHRDGLGHFLVAG